MGDLLKIGFDTVGNGIVLAGVGLVMAAIVSELIHSWPVLIICSINCLLLAVVLIPAIDVENPHGPTGFPALICLFGRGPNGSQDIMRFGVLPLLIGSVAIFCILWCCHKKQTRPLTKSLHSTPR